jgi:hypothetical protein
MAKSKRLILGQLIACANENRPCPTNDQLCGLIGANSTNSVPRILDQLADAGWIKIERGHNRRVVQIVATGQRTAGTAGSSHPNFARARG